MFLVALQQKAPHRVQNDRDMQVSFSVRECTGLMGIILRVDDTANVRARQAPVHDVSYVDMVAHLLVSPRMAIPLGSTGATAT